jgi:phage FluMu gp28-like protein
VTEIAAAPVIKFLPYQRAWIEDKSTFKIGMFARQTGKTFTTSGEIVDDCIAAEMKRQRARWTILSRSEDQSAEAMSEAVRPMCQAFYTVYRAVLKGRAPVAYSTEEFVAEREDGTHVAYKALEARFPSGSRITALSSNPDTARGRSSNLYLDEFAIHLHSREIWRAAFPIISRQGLKLRVTSTPKGKANKFYELWTAEDVPWSRHRCDIHEAVAQGLGRDVAMLKAALDDDEAWRQEYELEFLDESSAWLSYDAIVACEDEDAGKPHLYQGGPCTIGNDIARRGDLWVAWVWEQLGDVLWCREISILRGASFAAQDAEIARLMAFYNVSRLVMDQTGMGEKPVEDMQAKYGWKVEGVILAGPTRLNVASAGKRAFEDRKVRIPAGDAAIRADLHKLKRVIGETGAPRLVADSDAAGHADRAWSAFMGIAGAAGAGGIFDFYKHAVAASPAAAKAHAEIVARIEAGKAGVKVARPEVPS